MESALNDGSHRLGLLEGHMGTPLEDATTLWSGLGLVDSRVRVCGELLHGVPAQLDAANDASAMARTISERAHMATAEFVSNGAIMTGWVPC